MTGIKSAYVFSLLCSVFVVSTILISDVNARSSRSSSYHHRTSHGSSRSHSYPSHHKPSTHTTHSRLSGSGNSGSITPHKYTPTYSSSNSGRGSGSSGHHSYPPSSTHSLSGGSSGSTVHGYPSSGSSLSGSGGSRTGYASYPSNTIGVSGSSSSSVHSYPSSGSSLSGSGSASYPSNNIGFRGSSVHSYPSSHPNSLSGGSASGTRHTSGYTSWGSNPEVHHTHTSSHHVIHHHHNYVYSPPTVIHFRSSSGMSSVSYPVYRGIPPTYVYEYRNSGNRYSNLLAGLALYNLGRMSSNTRAHDYHKYYTPRPDEYCKFGVRYPNGGYDEMAIDCRAISYFIYEAQPHVQQTHVMTNIVNQTTVTTQTMFSNGTLVAPANTQTQLPASNGVVLPQTMTTQSILANGTVVVPANAQIQIPVNNGVVSPQTQILTPNGELMPNTQQYLPAANNNGINMPNTQQINTVTTTTTQVKSVTDPKFYGSPVQLNPEMECYVVRIAPYSKLEKPVPCALLQEYAASSLRRSSGAMVKSSLAMITIAITFLLY